LHPNAKYQKAAGVKRAIIDQGHYQSAMSFFETKETAEHMKRALRGAAQPDMLFLFKLGEETRTKRLLGRSYIVRARDGEAAFRDRLAIMEHNFNLFLSSPNLSTGTSIVIDSEASKDKVYAAVVAALTPHLS
jgi:adenylate kinase family enzyme